MPPLGVGPVFERTRCHSDTNFLFMRGPTTQSGQTSALGPPAWDRSKAEQAIGVAAMGEHDLATAVVHLRRAVRIATRAGLATRAAQARIPLVGALAARGDLRGAQREIDRAAPVLEGRDRACLDSNRAFVLEMSGRRSEAVAAYSQVLVALHQAGDRLEEGLAYENRGLACADLGDFGAAEADLMQAEALFTDLDDQLELAELRVNRGWLAARQGDLPAALEFFDQADEYFAGLGRVNPAVLFDRCEALLAAHLGEEARRTAEEAIVRLEQASEESLLARARLLLCDAALLCDDVATARSAAEAAALAFSRQRRPSYLALARYASVRAAWAGGDRSPALLRAARQSALALTAAGWAIDALDARLIAAQLALAAGHLGVARRELAHTEMQHRGPAHLRSRIWHSRALLALAEGNRQGAQAALRAGMAVLDSHRALLGATELRAHSSAHAADLARLGLRLALEDANPAQVLAWAERWRCASLQLRPVRPPADQELRHDLACLRQVMVEIGEATDAGTNTKRLLTRQAHLEVAVRRRARQAAGTSLYNSTPLPTPAAYRAALGDRALVELVELDGQLVAIVIAGERPRLRHLGSMLEVTARMDHLRFALRRMVKGQGSDRSLQAAATALASASAGLDRLLWTPLEGDIAGRPLVVVPTGALHALAWASLPSCKGRSVVIAPSAAFWYRAAMAEAAGSISGGGMAFVAGPGLAGAESEVRELHRHYPASLCLSGQGANVTAVAEALDGCGLAHVAAHGTFRADNPLFSSLRMADGPLTVYDLEALGRAPDHLILSACDAARSAVRAGDELMGVTAALLALGTRTVIAAVTEVADEWTLKLMLAVHREFRAGVPLAMALAQAQVETGEEDDFAAQATAAAFVCLGTG